MADIEFNLTGVSTVEQLGGAHRGMRVVCVDVGAGSRYYGRHGTVIDSDSSYPNIEWDTKDSWSSETYDLRAYRLVREDDFNQANPLERVYDPDAKSFTLSREEVEELIREAHDASPLVADKLRKVLDPRTERTYSVTIRAVDPSAALALMQKAVEGKAEIMVSDEGETDDLF